MTKKDTWEPRENCQGDIWWKCCIDRMTKGLIRSIRENWKGTREDEKGNTSRKEES